MKLRERMHARKDRQSPWLDEHAVQNLLQNLCMCYEPLPLADEPFKQSLRVSTVNVRGAHQIHGDIRVDQNHGFVPTT
jgi:hypothetical protein